MNFQEFIKPELLVLIPVLYLIGTGIKNSSISNKHIPLILGVCGVLLSTLYILSTERIEGAQTLYAAIFSAITQGILVAGASVYANELIKQAKKE